MKVMQIHEYGGPEQMKYEDAARPEPGPGQVLVRVAASSVNPADWKIRSGAVQTMMKFPLPLILGGDVAGVIAAVGEEVAGWKAGDEVFALVGLVGAYAQYVTIDAAFIAAKPANIDFVAAGALPLVSLTAWLALAQDGREMREKHVLVHNAAGGVGSVAVQIAKARGANVTATASAKNAEFVAGLGADKVTDVRQTPADTLPQDVDVLLDFVGNAEALTLLKLVKPGGSVTRIGGGPVDPALAETLQIRAAAIRVKPDGAALAEIAAMVEAGKIKPHVAEVFALQDAGRAHEVSQAGHVVGKVVLKVG
jgi:NADPH:quinone reductase-like Zn-dependent oxidoreductase